MKEEFIALMCCPACRGELELRAEKRDGDEIMDGLLVCGNCGAEYRIKDGIPYMIVEK